MRPLIAVYFIIPFFAASCAFNANTDIEPTENGVLIQDQELVSEINSSPDTVTIDGIDYSLESYMSRNFMPIVEPPVRLNANNTLIREDGNALPSNIKIVQHYIVNDSEVWVPDDIEVKQSGSNPNYLDIISREGPTWETGTKVDVALEVKHQETDEVFMFSVTDVSIIRTE